MTSLKGILLYWLNDFLSDRCEEERKRFIGISHNNKKDRYSDPVGSFTDLICQAKVPLQKKQIETSVLYVSALPQVIRCRSTVASDLSQRAEIQTIVTQLNQFKTQSSKRYLENEDVMLRFFFSIWNEFEIASERAGWVTFRLSKRGIAQWIQHLLSNNQMLETSHPLVIDHLLLGQPLASIAFASQTIASRLATSAPTKPLSRPITQTESRPVSSRFSGSFEAASTESLSKITAIDQQLWQVQHTHARCCSFIHRWKKQFPAAFVSSRITIDTAAAGYLHSQPLLHALIDMSDAMFWIPCRCPSEQHSFLLKAASQLCQAFERFSRNDLPGFWPHLEPRQWRDLSKGESHPVMQWQAVFSLVIATRNMLKILMQKVFQVSAPESL